MQRSALLRACLVSAAALLTACRADPASPGSPEASPTSYNPDWTTASHGKGVAPDYATVLPQAAVNSIEITMRASQWDSVKTNMRTLFGSDFGAGGVGGPGGGGGGAPGGGGGLPGGGLPSVEPDYVDVTLKFNGKTWKNVGWRLKGNSSLSSSWRSGTYKLPFRMQFDEFEDKVPAIADQRFHGFKELSFSPGFSDPSLIREKLAADIFRLAGVNAARSAFYRVSIDFGAGLKYCGVYTALEVIDDTMVKDQFGSDSGNIYKPESNFQTFVQSQFEKKNNETAANYTDVQSFLAALNSTTRTSNAAAWRAGLEATFDMDHFLKRLAVNNAIVNWDTYGAIAHNYYLFNHPTRKLIWIPWDHNQSMTGSPGITAATGGGGGFGPGGGGQQGVSLSMNEVGATWPLLRYVADDPVYLARYKAHMKTFNESVFTTTAMNELVDRYTALISPYVVGVNGEQTGYTQLANQAAFTAAASTLRAHLAVRRTLMSQYVP